MNLDKIIALHTKKPTPTENMVHSLAQGLFQAMGALSQNFPAAAGQFSQVGETVKRLTEEYERKQYSAVEFFSGRGTVGLALTHYVTMREYVENIGVAPAVTDQVAAFNYQPITEGDELQELNQYMSAMLDLVRKQTFMLLKPTRRVDLSNVDSAVSGLYGRNEYTGEVEVVVCVDVPKSYGAVGMKAVYVGSTKNGYSSEPPQLYLYHPLEKIWLATNWTMTVPGLKDEIEKEFNRVFNEARPLAEDFIFRDQTVFLQGMTQALFLKAEFLPSVLYHTLSGGLSKGSGFGPKTVVFRQDENEMVVYYKAPSGSLKFSKKADEAMVVKKAEYWINDGITQPLPDEEDITSLMNTTTQIDILKHVGSALEAFVGYARQEELSRQPTAN